MDLNRIAFGSTRAVSPGTAASLYQSAGSATAADGTRTPIYDLSTGVVDVQGLTGKDLQHLASLNITGVVRKVYLDGNWQSVARAQAKGGDILVFDGFEWLVATVFETQADWCSVCAVQQKPKTLPDFQVGLPVTAGLTTPGDSSDAVNLGLNCAWETGLTPSAIATLVSSSGVGIIVGFAPAPIPGNGPAVLGVTVDGHDPVLGSSVWDLAVTIGTVTQHGVLTVIVG